MMPTMEPDDVLRFAVEEYRFQVRLNADRSNYWFGMNIAVLVIGGAVANLDGPPWAAVVIFLAGAATSSLCARAVHVQHGYYHSAREFAKTAAEDAGVPDLLHTTPGMRGVATRGRLRIVWVTSVLFMVLALVGVAGAVGVLAA